MNLTHLLHFVHYACYAAILSLGLYGVFCILLLRRQLARRQFRSDAEADEFLDPFRDHYRAGRFAEADELCAAPEYFYKATPMLARTILERRQWSAAKVKPLIAGQFARDVLTSMESLIASVNVIVKCEPMLGLLGTVVGMIGAFGRIAVIESPSPKDLMADLSVALNATALGLTTAIPLLLLVNYFQVRLRKFEDATFEQVQELLDETDAGAVRDRAPPAAARAR